MTEAVGAKTNNANKGYRRQCHSLMCLFMVSVSLDWRGLEERTYEEVRAGMIAAGVEQGELPFTVHFHSY